MPKKRKAGEGTLRLRKDGRWEGRIVVDYDGRGYPVTKSVTAKTKPECLKKLEELKTACGVVTGKARPDMSFGEWMDLWYHTYCKPALRITTQSCYEDRIYLHIIPSLGSISLNKLTQSNLQQFYADLKKNGRCVNVETYGPGLSDRMVRACHTTCHAALQKAVAEGLIPVNPSIGCKLPPKKAAEMQVLTKDEIRRFLIQAKENDFFEIAVLELSTGMRRGELCALKWTDLNLRTGALHVQRQVIHFAGGLQISVPKTKSSNRTIILPPVVLDILSEMKKKVESDWIFPSPVKEGDPLDPLSVYRKMRKVLERAECKQIRFHDLRHTFATMALENGMDIKTLSATIGHVSSATTIDIYSHITDAMQMQAANRIEQQIGKGETFYNEEVRFECESKEEEQQHVWTDFQPKKNKIRKSGTGGIYQINDHLFEGRYTPTNAQGKREVYTVYAKTREEVEPLLEKMIEEVRAKIKAEKAALKAQATE